MASRNLRARPNMMVSNFYSSSKTASSVCNRTGSSSEGTSPQTDIVHCPHDALAGVLSEAVKGKTVKQIRISKSTNGSHNQSHISSSPVKVIKLQVHGQYDTTLSDSTVRENKSAKSFYKKTVCASKFASLSLIRNFPQRNVLGLNQTKPQARILKLLANDDSKNNEHCFEAERKEIKVKSALDEFLESVESSSSIVPQKFVPNPLENLKSEHRPAEPKGSRCGKVSNSCSVKGSSPRVHKPKVLIDPEFVFNSQLSTSPAISPFLHFNPNGRVPDLINPLKSNSDLESRSINEEMEQLATNEFPTLDSIFRDFKEMKERDASVINTSPSKNHKLSMGEVKRLLSENEWKSSPSLNAFMGRHPTSNCAFPSAPIHEIIGGQQFTKACTDSYSPVPTCHYFSTGSTDVASVCSPAQLSTTNANTPIRNEPTNAFKLLTYSAPPADKTRDKMSRKRQFIENSNDEKSAEHLHPALIADPGPKKRVRRSMKRLANDDRQLVLDFGQRDFGPKWCKTCGFVYTPSHPDDLKLHEKFHNKKNKLLKYTLKGGETVLDTFEDGCIVQVDYYNTKTLPNSQESVSSSIVNRNSCSSYLERVVSELRERVDAELGFVEDSKARVNPKILVFISRDSYLTGYLLAEEIKYGYRVVIDKEPALDIKSTLSPSCSALSNDDHCQVPSVSDDSCTSEDLIGGLGSWSCSLTPERAVCGVSRIWVAPQHKRKAIATRMVNALRKQFWEGVESQCPTTDLPKELLAFSDPTNAGRRFAASYCGREDFLVFKCIQSDQPVRDFLKEEEERDKLLL